LLERLTLQHIILLTALLQYSTEKEVKFILIAFPFVFFLKVSCNKMVQFGGSAKNALYFIFILTI
jgi:hypothetical protein